LIKKNTAYPGCCELVGWRRVVKQAAACLSLHLNLSPTRMDSLPRTRGFLLRHCRGCMVTHQGCLRLIRINSMRRRLTDPLWLFFSFWVKSLLPSFPPPSSSLARATEVGIVCPFSLGFPCSVSAVSCMCDCRGFFPLRFPSIPLLDSLFGLFLLCASFP